MPLPLIVVLVLIAAWLFSEASKPVKDAKGDVELGVGTVDGVYGNDVYYSRRQPSIEIDPSNPAVDDRMRELIWESNRAISEDDAAEAAADAAAGGSF